MSLTDMFSKSKSEKDLCKSSKSVTNSKRNRSLSPIRSENNSSKLITPLASQNVIAVDNLIAA